MITRRMRHHTWDEIIWDYQELFCSAQNHHLFKQESAKLRATRAKNVLTCQSVLRAYVLTCQRALRA